MRGGPSVGEATLGRFFALHVMGLPMAFLGLVGFHLFCVRRVGVSSAPFGDKYRPTEQSNSFHHDEHFDGVPFHPNYTVKEIGMVFFALAALVAITFYAPWLFIPLDALVPADPFVTPDHIKPEWYFFAIFLFSEKIQEINFALHLQLNYGQLLWHLPAHLHKPILLSL